MKSFVTEESFWNLFPEARIGIVVAHDMQPTDAVSPEHAQAITWALAAANEAADRHLESNTISQNEVVAVWRDAYQQFKTKKGARCSIENLLKRVLKGNPVGGELCYRDNAGAICRCWNWRDGQRTALTDESAKAFLIIESVDPTRADDLRAATDELAAFVQEHLGATIFAKQIVTRDNPTMVIDE